MISLRRRRLCRFVIGQTAIYLASCAAAVSGQETRDRDAPEPTAPRQRAGTDLQYLPPRQPSGRFKLGVGARNTQTGVLLTQVLPDSVAQTAGLEARDTIVTVAGYQVGYVGQRLYDLGDELARRVDSQGRVTLLVRNHRDGRLVNVPLRFTDVSRSVSGKIRSQVAPPTSRSAALNVRLLDVTRPHWQDVMIAEVELPMPKRWPASYRLDVDSDNLRPGHRYAVDARVFDRGRKVLQTARPLPVSMSGSSDRANLTLVSLGNRVPSASLPLERILEWYLRYLGRRPSTQEMAAWQQDLDRGKSLEDVQAGILSSSEFFEQQQNDRDRYVDEVYRHLNGSTPTPEQHRSLLERLQRQSNVRHRFTQELLRGQHAPEVRGKNR